MSQMLALETAAPGLERDPFAVEPALYAEVEAVLAAVDTAAETDQLPPLPESLTNPSIGRNKLDPGNDMAKGKG